MWYNENNSSPIDLDFFRRYPHKIKSVDLKVDVVTQMEYFAFLSEASQGYSGENFIAAARAQAFAPGASLNDRKRMLALLSCSEEVEVLRALEQYEERCPGEMKDFMAMCVYQCRTGIEAALLGEHQATVVSGMGGKDNKIRYFAALATLSGESWSATEQHLLREELMLTSKEYDAEVEMLEFSGKYAKMLLLTPITLSPVTVVQSARDASNALGVFIRRQEVITNISRLPDEQLDRIFSEAE